MSRPFPIEVTPLGTEEVAINGPGFRLVLCAHGALVLASKLQLIGEGQHCDGYRHGDESTMFGGAQFMEGEG